MKITLNDLLNAKGVSEPLQGAVKALIDRLEAAESDGLEQARLNGMGGERELALMAKLEAAEDQRDALQAKVEAMERQEPVAEWVKGTFDHYPHLKWKESYKAIVGSKLYTRLYALPGAQPAPTVSTAQTGWLRAVDEALAVTHLGVANESDTYKQAREKLDNLIDWHVDIAIDPAFNGGYKLVPVEPTKEMLEAGQTEWFDSAGSDPSLDVYRAIITSAQEDKQ